MNKISIKRKEVISYIKEARNLDKSDQMIYNELSEIYYDKKTLVVLIGSTVNNYMKEKYKIANYILLAFLGLTIICKILVAIALFPSINLFLASFLIILLPILNIYFFYEVANFNASIYKSLGFWCIFSIVKGCQNTFKDINNMSANYIDFVVTLFVLCFAFYLSGTLLPDYDPKNLKQDENGDYIFPEKINS